MQKNKATEVAKVKKIKGTVVTTAILPTLLAPLLPY